MPDVLLFGGTETSLAVAEAVLSSGLELSGIISVGDSFNISYSRTPVRNVRSADIAAWCSAHDIKQVRFSDYETALSELDLRGVQVGLVAGWYHMVPSAVRERFPLGCLGFHASLLPKLRGGAPLNWAILTGESSTGVTMFLLSDGVDDGPIFGQESFPIGSRDTIGRLLDSANLACAKLTRDLLPGVFSGEIQPRLQEGEPSYGLQRRPDDGKIDWTRSAKIIDRLVRAVSHPYPGAFSHLEKRKVLIWGTEPMSLGNRAVFGAPGQLFRLPGSDLPWVVTGDGVIAIREASDENGESMLPLLLRASQKRFRS